MITQTNPPDYKFPPKKYFLPAFTPRLPHVYATFWPDLLRTCSHTALYLRGLSNSPVRDRADQIFESL